MKFVEYFATVTVPAYLNQREFNMMWGFENGYCNYWDEEQQQFFPKQHSQLSKFEEASYKACQGNTIRIRVQVYPNGEKKFSIVGVDKPY